MTLPTEDELVAYLTRENATAPRRARRGFSEQTARLAARRCLDRSVSVSGPPTPEEAATFGESLTREYVQQQETAVGSLIGFIALIFVRAFFGWAVQKLFDHLSRETP